MVHPFAAEAATFSTVRWEPFNTRAAAGTVDKIYAGSVSSYDFDNYHPEQESVHDGVLDITLANGKGAGVVLGPPESRWGQTYGRFSVRFKAVGATGYGTAMMLWPSDRAGCPGGCWSDGEIDFPEGNLGGTMWAHHHPLNCVYGGDSSHADCNSADSEHTDVSFTGYHQVTTEWTPSSVKYFIDSRLVHQVTHDVPTRNHRMTLQFGPEMSNPQGGHVLIDSFLVQSYRG